MKEKKVIIQNNLPIALFMDYIRVKRADTYHISIFLYDARPKVITGQLKIIPANVTWSVEYKKETVMTITWRGKNISARISDENNEYFIGIDSFTDVPQN